MANDAYFLQALWLTRATQAFIAKIHENDFRAKFSHQGLDLVELRALYSSLPERYGSGSVAANVWCKIIKEFATC